MNAKKRLFHSFFSLFDKDSISKQDFDKLKQFEIFLPNYFLIDLQNKVIQDKEKENQETKIQIEEKFKQEVEDKLKKEVEFLKISNEKMKMELEEKLKNENENEKMKPMFDKLFTKYQKKLELKKKLGVFFKSEIITDIEYAKKLQEWINDNDFFYKMKKGFSVKKDGFNSQNWHKKVDGKGKTLVIIKTKDNFIFGGFTQVGFNGNTGNINDSNAFIFSLRNDKGDRKPEKFTIKQGEEGNAIFSDLNYGPVFGYYDFKLSSNLQPGHSNFGTSYNLPNGIQEATNESKSYLAGSYNKWVVDELETYFI
ncbi:hypothetical protein M0811_12206 [Anaeramoeba ignava]|uniref:TLDc domain-containing protein n=1 Tax=Anaeramoeba ignava TaxID=1746090 RepID=A0A9Q0LAB7_ANAIG|nr:hypothetical protein M0811_12206 [Anaeramoeba ignava]